MLGSMGGAGPDAAPHFSSPSTAEHACRGLVASLARRCNAWLSL